MRTHAASLFNRLASAQNHQTHASVQAAANLKHRPGSDFTGTGSGPGPSFPFDGSELVPVTAPPSAGAGAVAGHVHRAEAGVRMSESTCWHLDSDPHHPTPYPPPHHDMLPLPLLPQPPSSSLDAGLRPSHGHLDSEGHGHGHGRGHSHGHGHGHGPSPSRRLQDNATDSEAAPLPGELVGVQPLPP
eukprot:2013039-Rhodomonas_salina.1